MVFAEEVFGGSVPKNFFPAVEKGLREACVHGLLAGYPVVNLKAVLYDGSYHPVDSSEIAFKTAAQLAYKAAMPEANPVLLEPVGELKVTVPDSYMGDVIGDLNKRRGRVMGMNPTDDGDQVIEAEVPMAEMTTYAIDLRAMTQSRGSFTFHFVRYEEASSCGPAEGHCRRKSHSRKRADPLPCFLTTSKRSQSCACRPSGTHSFFSCTFAGNGLYWATEYNGNGCGIYAETKMDPACAGGTDRGDGRGHLPAGPPGQRRRGG